MNSVHVEKKIRIVKWLIELNQEVGNDFLLFTSCDVNYLDFAFSLIKSADVFSPGSNFILHVINPDVRTEKYINEFVSSLTTTNLAVSLEYIDLSSLDNDQKIAYYASARFPQLAQILQNCSCPILSLDADSLIVNPIDFDFTNKGDAEVVLVRRDLNGDVSDELAVATGSIWLKPTPNVCQFMLKVAEQIDKHLENCTLRWFVDQVTFYQQMKLMQKQVKFYNLKRKYADWGFRENSVVWAGKGDRKENDLRFFLLSSFLSTDIQRNKIAFEFKSYLISSGSDLKHSKWMHERLNLASKGAQDAQESNLLNVSQRKVVLFFPRLDLPWKKIATYQSIPMLNEDVLDLRLYWKSFTVHLANTIERAGLSLDIIELPAWEITRERVEASNALFAFVPHHCIIDFDEGKTPVMFYMQEYFRSVFTCDTKGWSAASSVYPVDLETLPESSQVAFDVYRNRLLVGELGSKFGQIPRKSFSELASIGDIPSKRSLFGWGPSNSVPYIFFPLQIPHDQSIKYFSDVEEVEVVKSLVDWARENKVAVVLKPHPANLKIMKQFEVFVDNVTVFWSTANVYDLIEYSTAVYTINSGVGFESLLHIKPVVTFGRAEYDCVTFHLENNNFHDAWKYCLEVDSKTLESKYSKFINWFLGQYAIDLSQPELATITLDRVVNQIASHVNKSEK